MRERVVDSAKKNAYKVCRDPRDYAAGAEFALRYFKEYFVLEMVYQNSLLKKRESRCNKK